MKKRLPVILCLMLVLCLAGSCALMPMGALSGMYTAMHSVPSAPAEDSDSVTISREEYEMYQQFDKLLGLMEMADAWYYEDVDHQKMLDGAAAGLLAGLGDQYTFYYTAEDYESMMEDDEGRYAGVGIQIQGSYLTGLCTITRVFAGSPAEAAGVQRGDILYSVEDAEHELMYVTTSSLDEAVSIMRGVPGTDVRVTFLRGTEEISYDLTRAVVNVNRVQAAMLEDDIGYIVLYQFAGDCAAEFQNAAKQLVEQGAKGIIMDLRDNPGGWVKDAETIADVFLDAGIVCTTVYKNEQKVVEYRTRNGKLDVELVVLLNENSASSSEILAGCLRDRAGATLVGTQSFGKGIVQQVVPLEDGSAMQMTVAQYLTPSGDAVHKIGLTPDVEVHLDEGDNGMHSFGDLSDAQLARALEVMRTKLGK